MRTVLVVLVVLVVAALVARLMLRGGRQLMVPGPPQLPAGGQWQARHYTDEGHTVVAVARMTDGGEVLEEHVVARIPDWDENWSRSFLAAKQEAEERAYHLST